MSTQPEHPAAHDSAGHDHYASHPVIERHVDVAVVGGSAAGLAAAPEQTRPFDHAAYVDTDAIAAALAGAPGWAVEVHERRERPAGAVSTHHVHDVVLRARRVG
ncbi:hypothetical protein DUHN55_12910 [Helicobacter pylori]